MKLTQLKFSSLEPEKALITEEIVDQVLQIGLAAEPEEACGVLTPDSWVVRLPNVSPRPSNSFWIDSEDLVNAIREYAVRDNVSPNLLIREMFTIWHTHPGGVVGPSKGDIRAKLEGFQYLVIALPNGEATIF
jgi:proteasome lid subunit RPN8/RPN11